VRERPNHDQLADAAIAQVATLSARGITKRYGHVHALQGVDFDAYQGEVTALIGDNGAGKSTLVKILSGTLHADEGSLLLDGQPASMSSPSEARAQGVETVYQDLAVAPDLNTPANMFLGREIVRGGLLRPFGILNKGKMATEAQAVYSRLGLAISPAQQARPVAMLSGGQLQSVAIARAAAWAKKIVFFDEPTAALGHTQTTKVYDLIKQIRDSGMAVVLISHDLPDVLDVADKIQVIRHGKRVADISASQTNLDELIYAMMGGANNE
jgi:simple sugar transport system ATP-binding protein